MKACLRDVVSSPNRCKRYNSNQDVKRIEANHHENESHASSSAPVVDERGFVPRDNSSDGLSLVASPPQESSVDSNFKASLPHESSVDSNLDASVSAHGEYRHGLESGAGVVERCGSSPKQDSKLVES